MFRNTIAICRHRLQPRILRPTVLPFLRVSRAWCSTGITTAHDEQDDSSSELENYVGEGMDGMIHGQGALHYLNEDRYEGDFRFGVRHGQGKQSNKEGIVLLEGEWKYDLIFNGSGKRMKENGARAEGSWVNGQLEGNGTFVNFYGEEYVGEFHRGKRHGVGRQVLPNGYKFEGEWRDGLKNGFGVFTYGDERVYEGSFRHDLRDGLGQMKYSNGSLYEGAWKKGKKHGQGKQTAPGGIVLEGEWKEDLIQNGTGAQLTRAGDVLQGHFVDGFLTGHGSKVSPDGALYVGNFVQSRLHGQGTVTTPEGDRFEGEWKYGNGVRLLQLDSLPDGTLAIAGSSSP